MVSGESRDKTVVLFHGVPEVVDKKDLYANAAECYMDAANRAMSKASDEMARAADYQSRAGKHGM